MYVNMKYLLMKSSRNKVFPSPAAETIGFKTGKSNGKVSITSRKGIVTTNM